MVVATVIYTLLKDNGFYLKELISVGSIGLVAVYGIFVAIILPVFGLGSYINSSALTIYYLIGKYILGIRVDIKDEQNLHVNGPAVYVCNHQASLDVMIMGSVYPNNTAVVAKKALKYYPILGLFMTLANVFFVDRGNRQSAVQSARRAAESIVKKKMSVFIYPEGTRSHESDLQLLPFKKGAFYMAVQAHVPIVPIVFANYHDLYDSKLKRFKRGTIYCKVLPAISTDGYKEESADIEKLLNLVRDQMNDTVKEITRK
ncbi:hypothetical protein BDB01DRAFT_727405 [Pilobolus umbonatus]|nr:hypothetical protein BDB01DRAFT_727405 [Pilobolus umbonatus]